MCRGGEVGGGCSGSRCGTSNKPRALHLVGANQFGDPVKNATSGSAPNRARALKIADLLGGVYVWVLLRHRRQAAAQLRDHILVPPL